MLQEMYVAGIIERLSIHRSRRLRSLMRLEKLDLACYSVRLSAKVYEPIKRASSYWVFQARTKAMRKYRGWWTG